VEARFSVTARQDAEILPSSRTAKLHDGRTVGMSWEEEPSIPDEWVFAMLMRCMAALALVWFTAALAGAQELLRDDFSGKLEKWTVSAPAAVAAGATVLRLGPGGAIAAGDATWRDYTVSFRGRTVAEGPGDGHWGVHLRAVPGPGEGELYVFARPTRLSVAGSGKTEWVFPNAPAFDRLQEHAYRLTVTGAQVQIEVDGRTVGTAHDIRNPSGGIRFTAYDCAVELRDVVVTALAPEAGVTEPVIPVDLPVAALAAPALADRPERAGITVCNPTGVRRVEASLVVGLDQVVFPKPPNFSSLVAVDAETGEALPTQVDDLLGTGRIPAAGTAEAQFMPQLCVRVTVEPYSARQIRLHYSTAVGAFAPPAGVGLERVQTGQKLRVTTPAYTAEFDEQAQFSFTPAGLTDSALFSTRPTGQEMLVCRRSGPVRVLLITRREISENARLTRVVEAYPDHLRLTTTLAAANPAKDAFVSPVDGFWFGTPALRRVEGLRTHTVAGFSEPPPGETPPVERLFAGPNALAYDFVMPGTSVALVRRMRPDYTPAMALIGQHQYVSGGMAFGWRPPITVKRDVPHVQEIWLVPHRGGLAEFAQIDEACRQPLVLATTEGIRAAAQRRAVEAESLVEGLGSLATEGTRTALTAALKGWRKAGRAGEGLDAYLAAERALGTVDRAASARQLAADLAQEVAGAGPGADREAAPWRSLLGQARVCAAAAAWDLAGDHGARGAQRLARSAHLRQQARQYAAHAPRRLAPTTAAPGLYPYVTFSEGASREPAAVGFDVGHFWVPWGHGFPEFEVEPKQGGWNFAGTDTLFGEAAAAGMATIPLLNFSPPRWWSAQYEPAKEAAGAPAGSTGDARLVSPELLGRVPDHMQAFAEYIRQMATRYGAQGNILAWSVRNEPAYYECGGINGPLMREAFDHWIGRRYPSIAELNRTWGTAFADFSGIVTPEKWADNRAAWYDLMTFKAECLNGELAWEADLAMANSPVSRTGAKFVPACSGPQSARSGYGVDPWLTAGAQRGVAFCDLYLDDPRQSALRAAELSWGAGGVPVVSCETGASSLPADRVFRFHYTPDRRARAFPWMLLGYGLVGTHFWTWGVSEEYACLDWDGALCDFGLEAALANQEMLALRPALTGLLPRVDLGYLYPRASFVQGGRDVLEAYHNLYTTLAQAGYQVRLVAPSDFAKVAPTLSHIVVPPAEYVETALVDALGAYAAGGGTLVFSGNPGRRDEYARPREGGLQGLTGAAAGEAQAGADGLITLGEDRLAFANAPAWLTLAPQTAQVVGTYANGAAALTCNAVGKGKVYWLGMAGCQQPGDGGSIPLPATWKFALGDQWAQAPAQGQTSTQGHTDRGTAEGWSATEYDDRAWEDMSVPGVWEEHGHPAVDGWGWYRAHFRLPAEARGKRLLLLGDTLDDRARVYVNGKLVQETTSWDAVWRVDISAAVRAEGDNVIALRIEDTCLLGGVRGSVALVCPDLPSAGETVLPAVLRLAGAARTLSGGPTGVSRRVLTDGKGEQYLVVSNLSGAAATFELTVYGVGKAGKHYLDLLSGTELKARLAGSDLVLAVEVEAEGVRVIRL
jgi:hypothetical protein